MFKVSELLKATKGKLINGPRDIIVKGISIDSRTIKKNEAFVAVKGPNFNGHDFINQAIKKEASCIIKAQSVKRKVQNEITLIEVKDTQKALGDIAHFMRKKFNIPVIAVTGSNGKTTTKEMIAWVLSKKFKVLKNEGTKNNQIGLPLALFNLNYKYDIAVLELGTNHFGEIEYLARLCLPNIGIIANIGPAHLEYLGNLKGVLREKYALIENLEKPRLAILNADDTLLKRQVLKKIKKPFIIGFGIKNQCDFFAASIKSCGEKLEFLVNPVRNNNSKSKISNGVNRKYKFTLNTPGYYNIYNALAAITVARIFGMEYKDIALRLADFNFPEGRLKVITLNKIRFIDDTYNSNPFSLRQALEALDNFRTKGRKIFVMGDMLELGRQRELFHYQAGNQVAKVCDAFITVGKLSKLAADSAKTFGFDIKNIFTCESCQEARNILFNKLSPKQDDVVLVKGSRLMKMEEVFKI